MAEEASLYNVDLDPIEDKLLKFNPVATILRNALYVIWPLVIPNVVFFAIVALTVLVNLLGSNGIGGPLPGVIFILSGVMALLAVDVAMAWMVSGLKAELLARTALGFVIVIGLYAAFVVITGPAYRFSPFYLLTVSRLYVVTSVMTIGLSAWWLYSFGSGILAARQIPERGRFIARPDYFESRFSLETLERYGGLPPVHPVSAESNRAQTDLLCRGAAFSRRLERFRACGRKLLRSILRPPECVPKRVRSGRLPRRQCGVFRDRGDIRRLDGHGGRAVGRQPTDHAHAPAEHAFARRDAEDRRTAAGFH